MLRAPRAASAPTTSEFPVLPAPELARPVVRGRYAHMLSGRMAHVVLVDPTVWPFFGSPAAVNDALRSMVQARTTAPRRVKRGG